MAARTSPPATAFTRVLRAFETGGLTSDDVLDELRLLLSGGASPTELFDVLLRRGTVEPLPEDVHAEVLSLLHEAMKRAVAETTVSPDADSSDSAAESIARTTAAARPPTMSPPVERAAKPVESAAKTTTQFPLLLRESESVLMPTTNRTAIPDWLATAGTRPMPISKQDSTLEIPRKPASGGASSRDATPPLGPAQVETTVQITPPSRFANAGFSKATPTRAFNADRTPALDPMPAAPMPISKQDSTLEIPRKPASGGAPSRAATPPLGPAQVETTVQITPPSPFANAGISKATPTRAFNADRTPALDSMPAAAPTPTAIPPAVEPVKAPNSVRPAMAEPPKFEPPKFEPVQVEPPKFEPVQVEPVQVEPPKFAPAQVALDDAVDWSDIAIARDAFEQDPPANGGALRDRKVSRAGAMGRFLGLSAAVLIIVALVWYVSHHALLPTKPSAMSAAAVPTPGTVIRDCPTCTAMTELPTVRFKQGSAATDSGTLSSERPQHWVMIDRPLAMSTNLVTVDEFGRFIEATRRDMRGCNTYDGSWKNRPENNWQNPGFGQTGAHPVTCVSWNDADAYARWLSTQTGHFYRLPSASEWEYAARAGSEAAQPWRPDGSNACAYANVADASAAHRYPGWHAFACDDGYVNTSPVGSFKTNSWGLNDMLGNVFQWTQDCWHADYRGAPVNGSARTDGDCSQRELRGGSWFTSPSYVRTSYRNHFAADYRSSSAGIRLVRDIGP